MLERSQSRQRELDDSRRQAEALRQRNEIAAQEARRIQLNQQALENMARAQNQQRAQANYNARMAVERSKAASSAVQGMLGMITDSIINKDKYDENDDDMRSTSYDLEQQRQAQLAREQAFARQQAERERQEAFARQQAEQQRQEALARKQARDAEYDGLLGGLGNRLKDVVTSTSMGVPAAMTAFDGLKVLNPAGERNPFSASPDAATNIGMGGASKVTEAFLNEAIVSSNGLGKPVDNSLATVVDATGPVALDRIYATNPFGGEVAKQALRAGMTMERQIVGQAQDALAAAQQIGRDDSGAGSSQGTSTRWLGPATSLPVSNPFITRQEALPLPPTGMVYYRDQSAGQVQLRASSEVEQRGDKISHDGTMQCSKDGVGTVLAACESQRASGQ